MKASLNWLREFLPIPWTVEELTQHLTMAGIEVDGVEFQGRGFDQVVVAQILKSESHPNADRLSICEVDMGTGRKQIVCGAKNYKVGDRVPLALPGAKLPNGMEIKRSKLRGVESEGMMCSAKELGLAEDAEGLLILEQNAPIGKPLAEHLELNDVIFDLEITPNRPDLLSHWGLARELAVLADLLPPEWTRVIDAEQEKEILSSETGPAGFQYVVDEPSLCLRYTGRIIRGIQVGPSPPWLRKRLESLGHRSISNIVDITNYVLLEIGQPLHAFDLHRLKGHTLRIRKAHAGEVLQRLDGITSKLDDPMLVTADAERPVAIAGVIGGQETGVSAQTTDILLESATFLPSSVRRTSKILGLSTDSSYRFERGVDIELAAKASARATALILKLCGGRVDGSLADIRFHTTKPVTIDVRHHRVVELLGTPLPPEFAHSILHRMECRVEASEVASRVTPPSWRPDLEREIDVIEELGRIFGADKIPSRLNPAPLSTTSNSRSYLFSRHLRHLAVAQGLDEAQNYPLVSSQRVREAQPHLPIEKLLLANPLTSEMDALRPSLVYGLLESASRNLSGGAEGVSLFEIGKIFGIDQNVIFEKLSWGILMTGLRSTGASWEKGIHGPSFDYYDLKGVIEEILVQLKRTDLGVSEVPPGSNLLVEPGWGTMWTVDGKSVAFAGKLPSTLTQAWKIQSDVFFAEFDVESLLSSAEGFVSYRPWPVYPAIRRDLALTVDHQLKHSQVEKTLRSLARKHAEPKGIALHGIDLFDTFSSDKIGKTKKSLAYAMTYRSPTRTLTDTEINQIHEALKKDLASEISCEIRDHK